MLPNVEGAVRVKITGKTNYSRFVRPTGTVDTHRAYIMRKLQLETRAELVMFALANGVIGPDAG